MNETPGPRPPDRQVTEADIESLVRATAAREGFQAPTVEWTDSAMAITKSRGRVIRLRRTMLRDANEARFVTLHELGHIAQGHLTPRRTITTAAIIALTILAPLALGIAVTDPWNDLTPPGLVAGMIVSAVLLAVEVRLILQKREYEADAWAARHGGMLTEDIARAIDDSQHPALEVLTCALSTHPSMVARIDHVRDLRNDPPSAATNF